MDASKLEVGMEFKNYKMLCDFIGEKVSAGNTKKYQLIDWDRYFTYEKKGHKFIIKEVYEESLDKTTGRGLHKFNKDNIISLIDNVPNLKNTLIDSYGIDLLNVSRHSDSLIKVICDNCNSITDKKIKYISRSNHTKCINCTSSNPEITIIKILKSTNVDYKKELTFDDLKGCTGNYLRFDFGIYNNNSLVGIIEYDGEYHLSHLNTITNDKLKDKYCIDNSIPLYRIPCDRKRELTPIVCNILLDMNVSSDVKYQCERLLNELYGALTFKINI